MEQQPQKAWGTSPQRFALNLATVFVTLCVLDLIFDDEIGWLGNVVGAVIVSAVVSAFIALRASRSA